MNSIFSWFLSNRVPHVKIETFKSNNSETDRLIQINLATITHFSKLSRRLKFGVEIRKKKIWSFLTGFSSKKSKLSFYAKKYAFELKWPCWFQIFSPEVSTIKLSKVMSLLIIFCLQIYDLVVAFVAVANKNILNLNFTARTL